ncbi:MAG: YHS domain-containing (seleno)protein [Thermodesulfovibrionales bacterium]
MKSQEAINRIVKRFIIILLLLTGCGEVAMGELLGSDIAIKGYDTVAYFKTGKALKGNESFSFKWHDLTWYFSIKENRDLFTTSPEKYAPQYDGYCAWAMTEARKAQTDPEVWQIVNGKLYLQCSQAAYEKWSRDIPGNIKKADMNWLKFINKN